MSSGDERRPRRAARPLSQRALARMPMFPLPDLVFFPGTVLPLHIFEPRYRKMTRDVLDRGRMMAVGLQLGAELPDRPAPPFADVVTVGEVMVAEPLPDGRFNLVLQGRARVRVLAEVDTDEPYRIIRAEELPDAPVRDARELAELESSLRAIVEGLCLMLPEGGPLLRQVVASQPSASELANVLSSTLVVDAKLRQALLETLDVAARMERLAEELAQLSSRIGEARPTN